MTVRPGQTVSHYKILEHLGGGGMGVVYKAQDLKLERPVALKFLSPELVRDPQARGRFIHEAKAASLLQHTNICTVHDVDETSEGALFIVMEFYDGETLKERIDRGPLPINEAEGLAIQIAEGLAEAHRAGIVHRDIKPANIHLTKGGVAKILDFGLAKLAGRTLITTAGSTLGTAAYMSPEQANGEPADGRTDIWSFGVVLYEMLAGQRPFRAEYENALIYAILNVDPQPLSAIRPDVPKELEHLVARCLARRTEDRYQSMGEIVADLRGRSPDAAGSIQGRKSPEHAASSRRRRKIVWYGLTAFAIMAAGLLGYFLFWTNGGGRSSAADLTMIAVLPFENLGPAEDEYFADGLTDEITSRLSAVSSLGVISRTSSMVYKQSHKSLPVIADELGVDYILEGTVRWVKTPTGHRLRITPRLVQVSGDRNLWADNIDRTLNDVFAVQTEIASRVVDALGIVLQESERGVLAAIPTRNLDAYQAFLRGSQAVLLLSDSRSMTTALQMFERAIALDSTFALAHSTLAFAHLGMFWWGHDRTTTRIELAKQSLDKAFALQPDLPDAYGALAYYYYWGFRDYEKALEAVGKAELSLPNDTKVLALRAYILKRQGQFREALKDIKKVSTLDPKSAQYALQVSVILVHLGEYPEAERYLDRAIALRPDETLSFLNKADMYLRWRGDTAKSRTTLELVPSAQYPWEDFVRLDIYRRDYGSALELLDRSAHIVFTNQKLITPVSQVSALIYRYMGDTVRSRMCFDTARVWLESAITSTTVDYRLPLSLGICQAGLGNRERALEAANHAANMMSLSVDAVDGAYPLVAIAQVRILLGDYESAVESIESLLKLDAPKLLTVPLLRLDPIYDPLRSNLRFQALLTKYDDR